MQYKQNLNYLGFKNTSKSMDSRIRDFHAVGSPQNPLHKSSFVSGHDFSRSEKYHKINRALAPVGIFDRSLNSIRDSQRTPILPPA
jgi:hypothetical protein